MWRYNEHSADYHQVCELDLIFNFQKAYAILDELIIAGEMQESSKKAVLKIVRLSSCAFFRLYTFLQGRHES